MTVERKPEPTRCPNCRAPTLWLTIDPVGSAAARTVLLQPMAIAVGPRPHQPEDGVPRLDEYGFPLVSRVSVVLEDTFKIVHLWTYPGAPFVGWELHPHDCRSRNASKR